MAGEAQNHEDFKLGAKEYWDLSKDMDSDDDDMISYDPTTNRKTKGPHINVKKDRW